MTTDVLSEALFERGAGTPHTAENGTRGRAEQAIARVFQGEVPWANIAATSARPEPRPTLVLGIGGSALGARAALAVADVGEDRVRVVDTVDPDTVRPSLEWAQAKGASLQVISKSGRTVEVRALLAAAVERGLTRDTWVIGDPGPSQIVDLLASAGVGHQRVPMPAEVGGRYSVFTAVGQMPLWAAGIDPAPLLQGAREAIASIRAGHHESLTAGLAHRLTHPATVDVVWSYADAWTPWVLWWQQLQCESLGRELPDGSRAGSLVVPLRGPADQHSVAQLLLDGPRDKRVWMLGAEVCDRTDLAALSRLRRAEFEAARDALELPTEWLWVRQPGLDALGRLMVYGLALVVTWAKALGLDPYGQPAVERIKRRIKFDG